MVSMEKTIARPVACAALFFCLVAGLAACGDSSSSSGPGPEPGTSSASGEGGGGEGGSDGGASSEAVSSASGDGQTLCFNTGDTVRPNSPIFAYDGVWYPEYDEAQQVEFLFRHSPECRVNGSCIRGDLANIGYNRVHAGAIVRVNFVSSGDPGQRGAQALFSVNPEVAESNWRKPYPAGPAFGVHQDGVYKGKVTAMNGYATTPKGAWINMSDDGAPHSVEITLPHQLPMRFHGLRIMHDNVCFSVPAPLDKPVMAVVGNSLAHGEGQFVTEETFAWIASRELGYELVNLAVGGSTITPEMVSMNFDASKRVDLAVVEWGFNDWNAGGIDAAKAKFAQVIENIRAVQPAAKIAVIVPFPTLIGTTFEGKTYLQGYGCVQPGTGANEGVGVCTTDSTTIEDWRQMERDVVAERQAAGDANIVVVDPVALGMEANLTELVSDGIHLSVAGAAKFGPLLAAQLQ